MRVRILGPFHLEDGSQQITIGSVRQRAVLTNLLLHVKSELVADALANAVAARDPGPGVIFHSDHSGRGLIPRRASLCVHCPLERNASRWCLPISLRRPALAHPSWPVRNRSWMSSVEMPSSSAASSGL
jgi:hypothetical protein